MTDSKQIEAVLAPHTESLMCVLDFAADRANLALAGRAANTQLLSSTGSEQFRRAQQTLTAVTLLSLGSFEPVKDGKIDYSTFTKEVRNGLWEICTLGSCKVVKDKHPELARKLRAAEFDYHAELARALAKLY